MKKYAVIFSLPIVAFFTSSAFATCQPVYKARQGDDSKGGVPLIFGSIKLQPAEFMPTGLIGSTTATVGQAQSLPEGENQLLYTCDLADQGQTYEYFATNGDSNVGGNISAGEGVYQTYFPFIGIKLIRDSDGKVFSRYWQHSPIEGHREGNKLNFYARDFSGVTAEIYRLPSTMRGGDPVAHWGCNGPADDSASGIAYTCPQPNGYTVFVGPGWNDKKISLSQVLTVTRTGTGSVTGTGLALGCNTLRQTRSCKRPGDVASTAIQILSFYRQSLSLR